MRKITILILFILVTLTWGTTWMAMKIAVETIPPIFATGIRFIFAFPFLIFIAWIKKAPLLFPTGQRFFQFIISIFYFAVPFSLMIYGENYVSSGLASIIFANMPVAVLISSIIFLNEKTNLKQLAGLTMSIAALTGILLEESGSGTESHWQGIIALMAAVIIHAVIYTQCKKKGCTVSVITFNALPCFFAGVILFIVGWLFEKPQVKDFSIYSILSTMYLGVFAGVFGILCYFFLQKKSKAFQASLVFLIFPLIAISIEHYIYGYTISMPSKFMLIPLSIGIILTLVSKKNH